MKPNLGGYFFFFFPKLLYNFNYSGLDKKKYIHTSMPTVAMHDDGVQNFISLRIISFVQ